MKILHYSLGLPPYRSGGLTKYSVDLMQEQINQGNEVTLLWPGEIKNFQEETKIRKKRKSKNITNYEIVNPLPIPLLNGIKDYFNYTRNLKNKLLYKEFLMDIRPEIIHVHTLMGLHEEFFKSANELKIPIVFTSHDYFGLCPKVNFINNDRICKENEGFIKCKECNKDALTLRKVKILQSPIYRILKKSQVIKKIGININKIYRRQKKNKVNKNTISESDNCCNYNKLFEYYESMFKRIDYFHFNSYLAKDIYNEKIKINAKQKVVTITHKEIKDNRIEKNFNGKLKISYLGNTKSYKGFNLLIQSLDNINYDDFELNVYGNIDVDRKYINRYSEYKYNDLKEIFFNTDLLIIPSIWNETFGFIALEGKSYGVPTIITTCVGAKDIFINEYDGLIVEPKIKDLSEIINRCICDRKILYKINKNIMNEKFTYYFENHVKEINILYNELL